MLKDTLNHRFWMEKQLLTEFIFTMEGLTIFKLGILAIHGKDQNRNHLPTQISLWN